MDIIEAICKAYLQRHSQGPEVAGRTTTYYACRNCGEPIDMTGTGLEGLSASGDGGDFELALSDHLDDTSGAYSEILAAHIIDRAADKQRIAELETQIRLIMSAIPCGNISTHTPENAPRRIRDIVSECSRLEGKIGDQRSVAQKPRVMKRWGVDGVPEVGGTYWTRQESTGEIKLSQFKAELIAIAGTMYTHWLELEPTPTLPELSDDMSSLVGDGDA